MGECNATVRFIGAYFTPGANRHTAPESVWVEIISNPPSTWRGEAQLRLKDLTIKNLREVCPFLDLGMSDLAANRFLMQQLESGLQTRHIPVGCYFREAGSVNLPDGNLGFVRGDTFYPGAFHRPYMITPEISDIELCGDRSFSAQHILTILRTLPPQALLAIAYDTLTSVRSLVIGCGVGLQAVLYITGKNGLGKSRLAKRTALFYRSKKTGTPVGIVEADSTNAATDRMLHIMRDMPVVVEDLCLSTGRETERKRREQGARLVRKGTSEVPTVKRAGSKAIELCCNAGIVLTAEFTMETESDLKLFLKLGERPGGLPKSTLPLYPGKFPLTAGNLLRIWTSWAATGSWKIYFWNFCGNG